MKNHFAAIAGRQIEFHDVIDSTNTRAKQLAAEGAPHGMLVVAEEQTAGRGRMTRTWLSRPDAGLWMTLLVRPDFDLPARHSAALVFVAALAVQRTLSQMIGETVLIKWPNDLVLQGKKICGMLLESALRGMDLDWAVIGIGINLYGSDFPPELPHAGSVQSLTGKTLDRVALVDLFLREFDDLYRQFCREGTAGILTLIRPVSATLGHDVRAACPDGEHTGRALDFADDGALLMQTKDGKILSLRVGDVSVRGIMDYV